MSDRHLRTSALALASGLLLLASACGSEGGATQLDASMGEPAVSPTPDLDPMAGAPVVGSCYSLSRSQSISSTNTNKPVGDCYQKHNSLTYHVGLFPAGTTSSDFSRVSRECQKRLPAATGLSKGQLIGSVLDWVWFEPTTTQWQAGARWFRCDLVAETSDNLRLLPETSASTDLFSDGLTDRYVRCIRRGPDTNGDGEDDGIDVTCDKAHGFRWAGWFRAKDDTYPNRARFEELANGQCPRITSTQSWWVTWPLESGWNAGDRVMSCYKSTSS
ncbi:septum formation family protein [Nocardioides jensenii]|uniref:septum formation family protein n=1 Tax=Nocardioides jensenii TaxID=1843 RepID=UPI0012F8B35A|nr:septum formation family protein [Nocardioides jensenii]